MRIIADGEGASKQAPRLLSQEVLIIAVILLSTSGAFGVGYLTGRDAGQKGELIIEPAPLAASAIEAVPAVKVEKPASQAVVASAPALSAGGQYVASKNGTKYYLPWCGGVKNIKEENKVWFSSKEEAEAKGYGPAANCKGL